MSALVTADEMRNLEEAAVANGISEPHLMRVAAEHIAAWIDDHISCTGPNRHAVAVVGPGNNGGDALVALALLHERGWVSSAVMVGRDVFGNLPAAATSLAAVNVTDDSAMTTADVVIDGVFGIGSRANLSDRVARVFQRALEARMRRRVAQIAIDVPSGVDASTGAASDDAFRADVTLCLGYAKRGLVREPAARYTGDIVILPLPLPIAESSTHEYIVDKDLVVPVVPRRVASAHKSATGTVLIVGGAPNYYGAPRLAAEAAMRAGAGLVAVAVPEPLVPVIAAQVPECVFLPLPETPSEALRVIAAFVDQRRASLRAWVVGPGLGRDTFSSELLSELFPASERASSIIGSDVPTVIDADALNWLSDLPDWPARMHSHMSILTPHPGEMERLCRHVPLTTSPDHIATARDLAVTSRQHVLYKTGFSPLATPDGMVFVAPRASPELATAGTGDVLAGMLGGFLAQGMSIDAAGKLALWCGTRAGTITRAESGTLSVVARDIIHRIGDSLRELTEPRMRA